MNCEKTILKDIIHYDIPTINFIFKHASKDFKTRIASKIENIHAKSLNCEILSKIENIKKERPIYFQVKKTKTEQEIQQHLPIEEKVILKSFLETIFETNSPEYNQNLFNVLVDGLRNIDSEDVFQQAKFLLKFNSTTNNKIENLSSFFYHKATDYYKFRLWFENLTDYCSTENNEISF